MATKDEVVVNIRGQLTNLKELQQQLNTLYEHGVDSIDEKKLEKINEGVRYLETALEAGALQDIPKRLAKTFATVGEVFNKLAIETEDGLVIVADLEKQLRDAQMKLENLNAKRKDFAEHYSISPSGKVTRRKNSYSEEERAQYTRYTGQAWSEVSNSGQMAGQIKTAIAEATKSGNAPLVQELHDFLRNVIGYKIQDNKLYTAPLDPVTHKELTPTAIQEYQQVEIAKATKDVEVAAKKLSEAQSEVKDVNTITISGVAQVNVAEGAKEAIKGSVEASKIPVIPNNNSDEGKAAEEAVTKFNAAVDSGNVSLGRQQSTVNKVVSQFFGYQMLLRQLRRLWNEAIHTITELDKQLTDQAIVTNMTREQVWGLVNTYSQLANQTGLTQTEIAAVTTEYLKQGNSLADALVLTKAAASAATVAGISAADSVQYLTTAIHGFKLEAEDALAVSDKFAALAADSASDYDDLAIALSKVASQASLAGMSIDYTLALLTTGLDVTQEAPESIGTALKTVIARMREIKDYTATLEDGITINDVEKALKAVNIELRTSTGELRSTEDVLSELGNKWKDLNTNQQAAVAKAMAGTRQQSRLVAILENYNKVLKYQEESQNSIGATQAQQVQYLEGMEAAQKRLNNTYQQFIEAVVNSDEIIKLVNTATNFFNKLIHFFSDSSGFWTLIMTVATVLVTSLLPKIQSSLNSLLNLTNKRYQKEAAITLQLQQQNALYDKRGSKQRAYALDSSGFNVIDADGNRFLRKHGAWVAEDGTPLTDQQIKDLDASGLSKTLAINKGTTYVAATMQIIAALQGAIQSIIDMIKTSKEFMSNYAQNKLSEASKIQSQIYESTKLKTNIDSLADQFGELDDQVYKTTEEMSTMTKTRQQLINSLTDAGVVGAANMSNADLRKQARLQSDRLEKETNDNVDKLIQTLEDASYSWDAAAIWSRTLQGASIGGMAGGGVGSIAGSIIPGAGTAVGGAAGAAIGTFGGAVAGTIAGLIEQGVNQNKAQDAKERIKAMLDQEEGVSTFKNALLYIFDKKKIADASKGVQEEITSMYNSIINTFDKEDLANILEKYNYDFSAFADSLQKTLRQIQPFMAIVDSDTTTYTQKLQALRDARKLLEEGLKSGEVSREAYEAFVKQNGSLYSLLDSIGVAGAEAIDNLHRIYGTTLDDVTELIHVLDKRAGEMLPQILHDIESGLSGAELQDKYQNLGADVVDAIARSISRGLDNSTIATSIYSKSSNIAKLRESQAKYGSLSATDKNEIMTDGFFLNQDGSFNQERWDAFINGADLTSYLEDYNKQMKETLKLQAEQLIRANEVQLAAAKAAKASYDERIKRGEVLNATEQNEYATLVSTIGALEQSSAIAKEQIKDIDNLNKLTLDEVISYQQKQISAMKSMYQQEEKDLEDSLTKRKEAYQAYFDALSKEEELAEYETKRNSLMSSIATLAGGTDAISRNKVNDLRKQLNELEKDRAKTTKEEARTALLENIDKQIDQIKEYYDEFLNNDTKMLNLLGAQTYGQYINYLVDTGATPSAIEQARQEYKNLLAGTYSTDGYSAFQQSISATTAPVSALNASNTNINNNLELNLNGVKQTIQIDQNIENLVQQLIDYINRKTGGSFAAN